MTLAPMLAIAAPAVGAIIGLVIGIGLSIYVGLLDMRKREAGVRTQAQYRLSLLITPLLLAGLGALAGLGLAAIF